jgi:hypothetical protein
LADLFKDIIPSILVTKKNVLDDEKDYVPFIVNKALSYHMDCILYANQLNMMHQADKTLQYHYALNTIRSYKRPFQKWQKKETIDDLEAVKDYFDFSNEKAKEALTVLTESQLSEIKNLLDKGGVVNANKSRRSHRSEVGSS